MANYIALALLVLPLLQVVVTGEPNIQDYTERFEKKESCDLYHGSWVYDKPYPLYDSSQCSFIEVSFACQRNGRPDKLYLKYRWQPSSCDLPRFNGIDFLKRFRNKKIMFIGDSLSLNQWQSLICMLHTATPHSEYKSERIGPLSTFTFTEYNVSEMLMRNAFLVDIEPKRYGRVLKLDKLGYGKTWDGIDVLIFNTWHWWRHTGREQPWNFIQEGKRLQRDMDRLAAYEEALKTWARWVDTNVNPENTRVFFQGISPDHSKSSKKFKFVPKSASNWGNHNGIECKGETKPVFAPAYPRHHPAELVVEKVLRIMSKPVHLLNVTGALTKCNKTLTTKKRCTSIHLRLGRPLWNGLQPLVGVSRRSPAPIQPTGAERLAPPLQPTDEADAGDQSAKGIPMSVWCGHWSWKFKTDTCRTEPIPVCMSFSTFDLSPVLHIF